MKLTKTRFFIILCVTAMFFCIMPIGVLAEDQNDASVQSQYTVNDVVVPSLKAYKNNSNYDGTTIKTNLSPNDIIELTVTEHGGITKDGYGNLVFSNYAILSLSLKTNDYSMRIPDTNAYIISENDYSYSGKYIGEGKKQNLKTEIGYGVILTSCEAYDGDREVSEEMYIRHHNDRVDGLRITEDGDYHIVILMTVKEGGTKKKIAIEYVIPIRTKIYVTDESGEYHVKDAGVYHEPVLLDALERKNVKIQVDGVTVNDGYVLDKKGKHNIKVYGNGFLCENFDFEIFSRDEEHAYIYLSNVRKQLDNISYECENHFKVTWYSYYEATMTYWKDGNPSKIYGYTKGTTITAPGTYVFTLNIPSLENENKTFLVDLVGDDTPAINYNTLHTNRFNNFKTKWYAIYDEANGLYYCFSMDEYATAYDAAITIEKAKATDYGHYYIYRDQKYSDKVSLTNAMNKNALDNVKVVYYDPDSEQIEKYFSDRNFDGTVYLNSDFQFVRTSPAETDKVTFISQSGVSIPIDFFKPMSAYNLDEGVYHVVEEDRYGNRTEYSCIVDTTAPTASVQINGKDEPIYHQMTYTGRYFELCELIDEYDAFAVACVSYENGETTLDTYYYQNENKGVVFSTPGIYRIRIYDRNGNITRFTVNITTDKQYTLSMSNDGATLSVTDSNVSVGAVLVNGINATELSGKTQLFFPTEGVDVQYTVYTVNSVTGESDCAQFTVAARYQNQDDDPESTDREPLGKQQGYLLPFATAILIISLTIFVTLAISGFVLTKIWRRNHE